MEVMLQLGDRHVAIDYAHGRDRSAAVVFRVEGGKVFVDDIIDLGPPVIDGEFRVITPGELK